VGVAGFGAWLGHGEELLREEDVVIVFAGMDAAPAVGRGRAGAGGGHLAWRPSAAICVAAAEGRARFDTSPAVASGGDGFVNIDNGYGAATSAIALAQYECVAPGGE